MDFFNEKDKEECQNISRETLKKVFELLDKDSKTKNSEDLKINSNDLKKKIGSIIANFPSNEFQFFTGGKAELGLDDLL